MRPAITWVISDTHFYHGKCCEHCGRPTDFTEKTLRNMRRLLAPQDLLIHLGDVMFYNFPELKGMLDSVKGKKVLTMGNHDKKSKSWYMRNGFDFAADSFVMDDIVFSHKPIEHFPEGVLFNVHGHLHNTGHRPQESWWEPGGRHRLFVLEHHYQPIPLTKFMHDTAGDTYARDTSRDTFIKATEL
jgi:calcineurin-like phosphoesterase family protein